MNDFMYGGRAKIGLIYPAAGWVMEPEFNAMSPEGVAAFTTRVSLKDVSAEELSKIGDRAVEAAKLLAEAPMDVIALGCTSGSFVNGYEYDQNLIKRMAQISGGIPSTTTSTAVVNALKTLGAKKIAIATPYIDEVNIKAKEYFEACGFEVVKLKGLQLLYDTEIDNVDLEHVYKLAKEVDTADADAVAILCTGIRSVPVLQALETDLGKPVISAIQATFWHCLRIAGVKEKIYGFGSLLERY
jgi:maleate isomerase